jgi:hypothetical protein
MPVSQAGCRRFESRKVPIKNRLSSEFPRVGLGVSICLTIQNEEGSDSLTIEATLSTHSVELYCERWVS